GRLAAFCKAANSDIKVILFSGSQGIPRRELAVADQFVQKSDGVEALIEAIEALLAQSKTQANLVSRIYNNKDTNNKERIKAMEKQKLGNSDLNITPIGVGAWAMGGGGWEFGWGPQDDKDSLAAIHEALDRGINWIDTAAVYGLGRSERVVGLALKGRTNRPYIFTKCSLVWDDKGQIGHSLKAQSIRREVEGSLRRLNVDTIDLYQLHW